ncbi:MAG TPA: hypothetical protein VHV51_15455 [Polyangiaceae bacterium]|nr:hypothetical protein [Polyangiaceae bacterium]
MPGALIVIELSAPNVSDDALAVLVSSCSRAARGAECVLAKNAADESPTAVAIVSLPSEDKARVEVGVRQGEHDSWRTKDFAFLASDDALDRFRALGFAIGTLAESNPAPGAEAPAANTPERPAAIGPVRALGPVAPPAPTAARPPKPISGPKLFVAARGVVGPGLDSGPWRIAGELGLEVAPPHVPLYFAFAGSAATLIARDANGVAARWLDVSAGPGVELLGSIDHSGLALGASFLVERFDVSASTIDENPNSSPSADSRWLFGVEGALAGRVEVVQDLFLTADVRAAGLSAQTDVKVYGEPVGSASSFRYLSSFGIRVRLR